MGDILRWSDFGYLSGDVEEVRRCMSSKFRLEFLRVFNLVVVRVFIYLVFEFTWVNFVLFNLF